MYIYETLTSQKRSSLKSSNYPVLLFKLYWQSKSMQQDQKGAGVVVGAKTLFTDSIIVYLQNPRESTN